MLSDADWLIGILRIKTIFYEICEKRGIKDERGQATSTMQYSQNANHLRIFREQGLRHPDILDKVYQRFIEDQRVDFNP